MRLCKFSFLFFLVTFSAFGFDDNACLKDTFSVEVLHKGQPFGLLPVSLKIEKEGCIITIRHEKFKYIKKQWNIDVCREPVHIKKGAGAVEVLKKTRECQGKSGGPFCQEFSEITQIIQDDGLIFAPGQKEDISSDHGKAYCSYLLLKNYLANSLIFNRGEDYSGVLLGHRAVSRQKAQEEVPAPPSAPVPVMDDAPVVEENSTQDTGSTQAPEIEPVKEETKGEGFF